MILPLYCFPVEIFLTSASLSFALKTVCDVIKIMRQFMFFYQVLDIHFITNLFILYRLFCFPFFVFIIFYFIIFVLYPYLLVLKFPLLSKYSKDDNLSLRTRLKQYLQRFSLQYCAVYYCTLLDTIIDRLSNPIFELG